MTQKVSSTFAKPILLAFFLPALALAQSRKAATPAPPAPLPTKEQTVEYIHGKLLTVGAEEWKDIESAGDTCDLSFIPKQSSTPHRVIYLSHLDAGTATWFLFSPKILTLRYSAQMGKQGGTDPAEASATRAYADFYFALDRAAEIPDFQTRMTKAFTRLIGLCGGTAETEAF